jgi:hypothetical protein
MGRPLATIPAQLRFGSLSLIADEVYAARGVAQVPQTAMALPKVITNYNGAQSFLGVSQLLALSHPPLVPRSSSLPSAHRALSSTLPPCLCYPVCFSLTRCWATHAKQQATSAPTSSRCRSGSGVSHESCQPRGTGTALCGYNRSRFPYTVYIILATPPFSLATSTVDHAKGLYAAHAPTQQRTQPATHTHIPYSQPHHTTYTHPPTQCTNAHLHNVCTDDSDDFPIVTYRTHTVSMASSDLSCQDGPPFLCHPSYLHACQSEYCVCSG